MSPLGRGLFEVPSMLGATPEVFIPYNTQATSLAFGMGAAEQIAYDHIQKFCSQFNVGFTCL